MPKPNHLVLTPYDVILVDGEPAIILSPTMDVSSTKRKFSDTEVDCAWIREDGTLGNHFELTRDSNKFRLKYEEKPVQFIDNAKVEIRVTFPDDVKQQIAGYEKRETAVHDEDLFGVEDEHPSYGSIRLSRISGHAKLFMSPFRHQHFMGISISRAKRVRSHSNDRMHGELRNIVEVFLSEAQWARFITSAYDGSGTPCTIHHVTGTYMPEPPEGDEVEKFHEDVKKDQVKAAKFLREAAAKVEALFKKSTVSQADRKEVLSLVLGAARQLDDSMPFIIDQMRERMDKVVADAQTEVEAHINRVAQYLGMKELTGKEPPIKMLIGNKVVEQTALPPPKPAHPFCGLSDQVVDQSGKIWWCRRCQTSFEV